MNEWLNEWMNEWISEWMIEWVNEWMNEWMIEWVNEWMNESILPDNFKIILVETLRKEQLKDNIILMYLWIRK